MIIKETSDVEIIKEVMFDPRIFEAVTDDSSPKMSDIIIPLNEKNKWLVGYNENGKVIAITQLFICNIICEKIRIKRVR